MIVVGSSVGDVEVMSFNVVTADRRRWCRTFDSGYVLHRLMVLLLLLLLLLSLMIDVLDVNVSIERDSFIGLRSV